MTKQKQKVTIKKFGRFQLFGGILGGFDGLRRVSQNKDFMPDFGGYVRSEQTKALGQALTNATAAQSGRAILKIGKCIFSNHDHR